MRIVLFILQIIWGIGGLVSLGVLGWGVWQYRQNSEDLAAVERAKRIILFSSIGLAVSLIASVVLFIIQNNIGTSAPLSTGNTPSANTEDVLGLGERMGASSQIVAHYPQRNEKDVPRNASLAITFRDEVRLESIAPSGALNSEAVDIRIKNDDDTFSSDAVKGAVTLSPDKKTIKITPQGDLGSSERPLLYRVQVTSRVLKTSGDSMFGSTGFYEWQFETGTTVDSIPPFVVGIFPGAAVDASGTPRNAMIQVQMSESVDASVLEGGKLTVVDQAKNQPISGVWTLGNAYTTLLFTPTETCGANTCGQKMYCLPERARVKVALKAASLPASVPSDSLSPYRALEPFDGLVDLAGNAFDGGGERGVKKDGKATGPANDSYFWTFSVGTVLDVTPPRIESTTPRRDTPRVNLQAPLTITFSKQMDLTSLTPRSVTLGQDVNYWLMNTRDTQQNKTIATIFHDPLKENTIYTPAVQSSARDAFQNCFNPCAGPLR